MTIFDFLLSDPQFTTFGEMAVAAEKIFCLDPAACISDLGSIYGL